MILRLANPPKWQNRAETAALFLLWWPPWGRKTAQGPKKSAFLDYFYNILLDRAV